MPLPQLRLCVSSGFIAICLDAIKMSESTKLFKKGNEKGAEACSSSFMI